MSEKLHTFNVQKMFVFMSGTLHDSILKNAIQCYTITGFSVPTVYQVSGVDLSKVRHTAKSAGVQEIYFVNKNGLYTTVVPNGCLVRGGNGLFDVITVKDGVIQDISVCTMTSLMDTVVRNAKRIGVSECISVNVYYSMDLINSVFKNVNGIDNPAVLSALTLFAFASSESAASFVTSCDDLMSVDYTGESKQVSEAEQTTSMEQEPVVEQKPQRKQMPVRDKEKPQRKQMPVRDKEEKPDSVYNFHEHVVKSKQRNKLNKVLAIISVCMLLVSAALFGTNYVTTKEVEKKTMSVDTLAKKLNDKTEKANSLTLYKNSGTLNASSKLISVLMGADSKLRKHMLLFDVNGHGEVSIQYKCDSVKSIKAIVNALNENNYSAKIAILSKDSEVVDEDANVALVSIEDYLKTKKGSVELMLSISGVS